METLLSTVVQWAGDGIEIATPDARLIFVNAAFERMTGFTLDEIRGKTPAQFLRSEHQDPHVYDVMWQTVTAKKVYHGRIMRRIKSGAHHVFEITVAPVLDAAGDITHMVAISRDVTPKLEEERRNLELLDQVAYLQKMESMGRLAGRFAHDFNNLLTSIGGTIDLLREDDVPAQRELLGHAETAVSRAGDLTAQMLLYSGGKEPRRERVNLNTIALEMKSLFHIPLARNIQLHYDLHPALPDVVADATQLSQVVLNLITNAADAIGPTGGVITLTSAMHRVVGDDRTSLLQNRHLPQGHYVSLEVSDTGTGIEPSLMPKIFDPFFTSKETGHGLGLSSVLGIMHRHGGDVRVAAHTGKGSRFLIFLPQAEKITRQAPLSRPPHAAAHKVLLVEGDPMLRKLASKSLELANMFVVPASTAEKAWRRFTQSPTGFDLVLLNHHQNGREDALLHRIRAYKPQQKVVLFAAGETPLGDNEPDLVMEQPFSAQGLVSKVEELLNV